LARRRRTLCRDDAQAPIYFSYAWTEEDHVTLDVPHGYSVETLPADTTYDVGTAA
jgi:hypothetical protein